MARFDARRARELAEQLDLDVDEVGICQACLSFVSFAIDGGDEREIRHWTASMTPVLWEEGLALPARLALERARTAGLAYADDAIAEVNAKGGRSRIARAIVRRLAEQQSDRAQAHVLRMRFQPWPPTSA